MARSRDRAAAMSQLAGVDRYELLEQLGTGSYGAVVKALDKSDSNVVAIKVVPIETDNVRELMREISILKACRSKYIVNYVDSVRNGQEIWIVMEYCVLGSLGDVVRITQKVLTEAQLQVVAKDTLHGLKYLHKNKLIHRDIKAGNILVNTKGQSKLADFGVSTQLQQTISRRGTVIGSPYWLAPEVLKQSSYNSKADIWSLGITCIELAEGRPPLSELPPLRALLKIPTNPPPTLSSGGEWSDNCRDFVSKCLTKEADQRLPAEKLLKHRWIISAGKRIIIQQLVFDAMPKIEKHRELKKQERLEQEEKEHRKETAENESDGSGDDDDDDDDDAVDGGTMQAVGTMVVNSGDMALSPSPAPQTHAEQQKQYGTVINHSKIALPIPTSVSPQPPQSEEKQNGVRPSLQPQSISTQHIDQTNPDIKSSPYITNPDKNWQRFDIDATSNIRSADFIIVDLLKPCEKFMDSLELNNYLSESAGVDELRKLEAVMNQAYWKDKEKMEKYYVECRRQIRERIQQLPQQKKGKKKKKKGHKSGAPPHTVSNNID